jgi:hypothetical protein
MRGKMLIIGAAFALASSGFWVSSALADDDHHGGDGLNHMLHDFGIPHSHGYVRRDYHEHDDDHAHRYEHRDHDHYDRGYARHGHHRYDDQDD